DIKQHKVIQAKMVYRNDSKESVLIHFDIFNGQVAFVKLNKIKENDINWITRQQMEGQTVFNIDQNYFIWKLVDSPPKFNTMLV
ncbi:MAG: restriction endonuclease, partial [Candidatus Pacearchaeota archaeon]